MIRLHLVSPRAREDSSYAQMVGPDNQLLTNVPSAAIATVAGLAPADFDISLCDEAIEPVDFSVDADVIGITANVSQAQRGLELADAFRARGRTVIMGGPHVSLAPELFEGHADCLVVGELEGIAHDFFSDMRRGALKPRYQGDKPDLTLSPKPRWDLYRNERALLGIVQTSRGCPFECHFCDVIQYLGRVQRHKNDAQVVAEVQALYDLGYNFISLADDNFTVYRKRTKSLLSALADWNGAEGRDWVTFATQMSIDVARDEEILHRCRDAGLLNAFIGIESSDEKGLIESKKRQNLRVDLAEQCRKIVRSGVRIDAGLMVGFDSDDITAFRRQFEFAMSLPVGTFNVSVLVAPVATPFYRMLQEEGRIASGELRAQFPSPNLTTNFQPAQMSREELHIGAKWLLNKLLDPDLFYTRLVALSELLAPPPWKERGGKLMQHPNRRKAVAMFNYVMRDLSSRDPDVRTLVRRSLGLMKSRPDVREGIADSLSHYLIMLHNYMRIGLYRRGWAESLELSSGGEPGQARVSAALAG